MLRVVVFVSLIVWTSAAAGGGGFEGFCAEVEGNLEGTGDDRKCTKTLHVKDVPPGTGSAVCHHWGRFPTFLAEEEAGNVTCTWYMTGKCQVGDYIHGYCYKIMSGCDEKDGWTEVPLSDRQAFRWIALIHNGFHMAKFKLPAHVERPKKKYTRGQILPLKDGEEDVKYTGVILSRMPVFGAYPGDVALIKTGDGEETIRDVCRKEAFGESRLDQTKPESQPNAAANVDNHATGASGGRIIDSKDNKFKLTLSRNVYSPKLDKNGKIDLTHFHDICENICTGCFAATLHYLNPSNLKIPIGKGRYWLPGGQRPIAAVTDCTKTPSRQTDTLNLWVLLHHKKHGNQYGQLANGDWKSGLPNRACSDQGRYAMAYENGNVIDVPVFDRLPVICVRGEPPLIPESANGCLRNSEPNGKDNCKCKPGFKDLKDPNSWTHQKGDQNDEAKKLADTLTRPPGYLCVRDTCSERVETETYPYDAVLFVIDGSGSIGSYNFKDMVQFLVDAETWLPDGSYILMQQYGDKVEAGWGYMDPNWNHQEYNNMIAASVGEYHDGGSTDTYGAILSVTDKWRRKQGSIRRQRGKADALMIVITDGETNDAHLRDAAIADLKTWNIDLKYVAVGSVSTWDMERNVNSVTDDIIKMENYSTLRDTLKERLNKVVRCQPITIADVDEANKRPYE